MASIQDFHDLCRLCAVRTTVGFALHLFEKEGISRLLSKKIENCLPLQVHESDDLPKMICENCIYKLEYLFDFREKSLNTEKFLMDVIKEVRFNKFIETQENLVALDHHQMIMVPQNQLYGGQPIDPNSFDQREGILVGPGHEIILSQQNINIHASSIDHNYLSAHVLPPQECLSQDDTILIDSQAQNLHHSHFTHENLEILHQHHFLSNQLRLHNDIEKGISNVAIEVSEVHDSITNGSEDEGPKEMEFCENEVYDETDDSGILDFQATDNSSESISNSIKDSKTFQKQLKNEQQDESYIENISSIDGSENSVNTSNSKDREEKIYVCQEKSQFMPFLNKSEDGFACNICSNSYETLDDLDRHYKSHIENCLICRKGFSSMEDLNIHLKDAHKAVQELKIESTAEVGSDYDTKETINEDTEKSNTQSSKQEKPNSRKKWYPKVCKECGKSYRTNYKLAEHMRKHTGEKPFQCSVCDKTFRSKIGLAQHEAQHTGKYEYSCSVCEKGFQCKSYLMVHQRVHSDVKPFKCTTCGMCFKTKQALLDHTNRHLGVKPYICDICSRGFITKGLCRSHEKTHMGIDNKKYLCKVCNKKFVSKSYLQTHIRIHTGEKPFICEACGKGFLTKVDLRIHSTVHTGEKSFVCESCGKAFARRDALRCHRRSHTGERPYSCDICGQTFTQFTPMAIHKRLHTGERPYACEHCPKTFVSRSTMMSHAKKHDVR